jgi:hypothetical protein
MGFFQTVEKFAGFAGKKAVTAAVSNVPAEAAAFLKSLEGTEAFKFVHTEEEGFKRIQLMQGEKKIGQLKYKEFGKGYTVTGIYGEQKGAGMKLRTELARAAKAEGKEFLISDIYGSMSMDEMASWQRLKKMGHDVMEVNVPYAELGLKREGGKFAYKLPLSSFEAAAESTELAGYSLEASTLKNKQIMAQGAGTSSTSQLNRSINTRLGSRKTSGAL